LLCLFKFTASILDNVTSNCRPSK